MNFLRSLVDRLSGPPPVLIVAMRLTPERVSVRIIQNNVLLSAENVLSQPNLPAPLQRFAASSPQPTATNLPMTLPSARILLRELADYPARIQLDAAPVAVLRSILPPADFTVDWQQDNKTGKLYRKLIGATGYLGDGWFYRDTDTWQLPIVWTTLLLNWMDQRTIAPQDIPNFVRQALPVFLKAGCQSDILPPVPAPSIGTQIKQFFFGGKPASTHADVPIPPRPAAPPLIKPLPERSAVTPPVLTGVPPIRVERPRYYDLESRADEEFYRWAKRWADRADAPTESVSFDTSTPTYTKMTPQQKSWYFYWRSEVRAGNLLPVDRAYLLIHVFEALNGVGFANNREAFERLVLLWRHYHTQHRLDGSLVNWIADFMVMHKAVQTPLSWYGQVVLAGGVPADRDLGIEGWLTLEQPLSAASAGLIRLLSAHNPFGSSFSKRHGMAAELTTAYRQALGAIDQHLQSTTGKGLIELHRPRFAYTVERWPFKGALAVGRRQNIVVATVYPWTEQAPHLTATVTNIVKYTEYRVRQQQGKKTPPSDLMLAPEWTALVDALFPLPEKAVRGRKAKPAPAEAVAVQQPSLDDLPFTIDFAKVNVLAQESNALRERLLAADTAQDDQQPLAAAVDADLSAAAPIRSDPLPTGTVTKIAEAEFPPDWAALAAALSPPQWTVLAILLTETDVQSRLEAAARAAFTMSSLLIDGINEAAFETIGDLIITFNDGTTDCPPQIEDEDRAMVTALVEWARAADLLTELE